MKKAVLQTLLHTLEVVVSIGAAYAITQLFDLDNETFTVVIAIAVNSAAKFGRSVDKGPIGDYVNNR